MENGQFTITDINVYKECDEKGLAELRKVSEMKTFKKNEVVCKPGDRGMIYIVNKGRVELYVLSDGGEKFILTVLKKGNIFGDFGIDVSSIVFCSAMEPVELETVKTEKFSQMLMEEPKLLFKLFKYFYVRLLSLQVRTISLATDDVMGRLTKLLIQLAKPIDSSSSGLFATDKYTHEQLSQMLGVSRQTITMTLNDLDRRGFLKRKKKTFIFRKEKLQSVG